MAFGEKACWTQNRIEGCWIFNLIYGSRHCYPGMSGAWFRSVSGFIYVVTCSGWLMNQIRHIRVLSFSQLSTNSPFPQQSKRASLVWYYCFQNKVDMGHSGELLWILTFSPKPARLTQTAGWLLAPGWSAWVSRAGSGKNVSNHGSSPEWPVPTLFWK